MARSHPGGPSPAPSGSRGPRVWHEPPPSSSAMSFEHDITGVDVHPGTKVRFVVIDEEGSGRERVGLAEELCDGTPSRTSNTTGCSPFERCGRSAPFGWTEAELMGHGVATNLVDFGLDLRVRELNAPWTRSDRA